jgi:hypothetical protein
MIFFFLSVQRTCAQQVLLEKKKKRKNKKLQKKLGKTNSPEEARVRSPLAENPQTGPAVRSPSESPLSLSDDWCLAPLALRRLVNRRRRRHPTPGAEAFVSLFTGDEHPPGIPIPFLLCEAKHQTLT